MAEETVLRGRIIAPGAGFGHIVWEAALPPAAPETLPLAADAVEAEVTRLHEAVAHVRHNVEEHVTQIHAPEQEDVEEILSAHLLMLDDSRFFDSVVARIREDRLVAERAVEDVFMSTASRLLASRDPYLQARAEEVRDLCQSLRRAMLPGNSGSSPARPQQGPVVFATPCLSPAVVLRARRMKAAAFVTNSTAFSSHGAILLRAAGIPSLGGVPLPDEALENGTPVLVDAIAGNLHVRPSGATRESVLELATETMREVRGPIEPPQDARTADGTEVKLTANLDHPSQASLCLNERLSGVGLFRTEFIVLELGRIPGEDEQTDIYRTLFDPLAGRRVVVRTFDLGGDKTVAGLHVCKGPNPALGVRGLRRHLLRYPDEIRTQMRAILRAAVGADVAVLLPMVTDADDIKETLALLETATDELEARAVPFNSNVTVGAMIEVPSAALQIAGILPLVDFVSIGSNDLVQYLTASDRDNPEVTHYQTLESSGLGTLLDHVMAAARQAGRHRAVSVCGEIASEPEGARFLVRHGIRSLSVSPGAASAIRSSLASLSLPGDEPPEPLLSEKGVRP